MDIQDLMFLIATFVVDRREPKQLHDSSVDILTVSCNWMRGFDHLYKKIQPISISCRPTFHAPELLKSKYDDWEDHHQINKKSSQSETKKQR